MGGLISTPGRRETARQISCTAKMFRQTVRCPAITFVRYGGLSISYLRIGHRSHLLPLQNSPFGLGEDCDNFSKDAQIILQPDGYDGATGQDRVGLPLVQILKKLRGQLPAIYAQDTGSSPVRLSERIRKFTCKSILHLPKMGGTDLLYVHVGGT